MANAEKPKIDPRFLETIEGREFIKFGGLLHLATEKGISRIETEIIQLPTPENQNSAIIRAVVESKEDEMFTDHGDCSPANCHPKVAKHSIRIAETRAIARCLKLLVDSPYTCLEELADETDVIGGDHQKPHKTPKGEKSKETDPKSGSGNGDSGQKPMSQAQKNAIINIGRRKGLTLVDLEQMAQEQYRAPLINLSQQQASNLITTLQQSTKTP
jgi:hypothetical protein